MGLSDSWQPQGCHDWSDSLCHSAQSAVCDPWKATCIGGPQASLVLLSLGKVDHLSLGYQCPLESSLHSGQQTAGMTKWNDGVGRGLLRV